MPNERILRLAFAPTGELLAYIGYRGEIQGWDIERQERLFTLGGSELVNVGHAALAVGEEFVVANQGEQINVWNRHTRELCHVLHGRRGWVCGLALSPDEHQVASSGEDGTLKLWNLRTSQLLRILVGHRGSVRNLTYSPDGSNVISGGYDETVRIWDVQRGRQDRRFQGHSRWINTLQFSPNGEILAAPHYPV